MTTPAPAVEAVSKLAEAATKTASPMPVAPEMAQKFEALMKRTGEGTSSPAGDHKNVVSDLIERQQGEIRTAEGRADAFMKAAPSMTASEISVASMALTRDLAMNGFKLQVSTSITSGSNKSLQTLLKNQ